MANVLGTLFGDIAKEIRAKTGETGTMKPAEFPEKISEISVGSDPVVQALEVTENGTYTPPEGIDGYSPVTVNVPVTDDICYVTFMDETGTVELGKKAVATGDDCADPIARGVFGTPTKPSTAQYSYTFAGWAMTPNGGLDSNALKAVNENRTVYANFLTTIRQYTVRFFNGDTLLQSVTVPYGGSATYTGDAPVSPEDSSAAFLGFEPVPTNVTADMDCYAQYAAVALYSWDTVFASIADGTYKKKYAVGDIVPLDLGSEGVINMQIVAFDADNLADGSGKAPITWISKELLKTGKRMNPNVVNNDDGTYLEGTGSIGGWEKTEMRAYLKETIKPLIPEVVRNSIKEVTKKQKAYDMAGIQFTRTSIEDVWLPDKNEMFSSSGPYKSMFYNNSSRKKSKVGDTSTSSWWLRSAYSNNAFDIVHVYGHDSSSIVTSSYGVAIGFCT